MRIRNVLPAGAFVLSTAIAVWPQGQLATDETAAKPKPVAAPMLAFTAEFKTTRVQVLANGTTIRGESTTSQARDGEGRTYSSLTPAPFRSGPAIQTFHVSDPVAGTETRWDSRGKKATVYQLPPKDQQHGCWRADDGGGGWNYPQTPGEGTTEKASDTSQPAAERSPGPHRTHEDLGMDTIQGLEIHGERTTITTPKGEFGNDQPLVSTMEVWWSDEYRLQVRQIREDPRQGKTTRELVSFTPGEPDPALFQPPQGYEVVTVGLHQVSCNQ